MSVPGAGIPAGFTPLQMAIVRGQYPKLDFIRVVGEAQSPTQGVFVDCWSGPTDEVPLVSGVVELEVVSSDVADAAAGTGVQEVDMRLLDVNFISERVVVELDGTTPVVVPGGAKWLRHNFTSVSRAGSGEYAAGTITIRETGPGQTWGIILSGWNETRQSVLTVPAGIAGYLWSYSVSSDAAAGASLFGEVRFRTPGSTWELVDASPEISDADLRWADDLRGEVSLTPGTDFKIRIKSSIGSADVFSHLRAIIEQV